MHAEMEVVASEAADVANKAVVLPPGLPMNRTTPIWGICKIIRAICKKNNPRQKVGVAVV